MGERPDQIVAEIEQSRGALGRHLNTLERRLQEETDWRVQFARRPWIVLGCAALVGVLLARLLHPAPRRR